MLNKNQVLTNSSVHSFTYKPLYKNSKKTLQFKSCSIQRYVKIFKKTTNIIFVNKNVNMIVTISNIFIIIQNYYNNEK